MRPILITKSCHFLTNFVKFENYFSHFLIGRSEVYVYLNSVPIVISHFSSLCYSRLHPCKIVRLIIELENDV